MATTLTFSIAFIFPTLHLHLLEYNLSNTNAALCFTLFTGSYGFFAFFGNSIFKSLESRTALVIGTSLMGLGFLMLTP